MLGAEVESIGFASFPGEEDPFLLPTTCPNGWAATTSGR